MRKLLSCSYGVLFLVPLMAGCSGGPTDPDPVNLNPIDLHLVPGCNPFATSDACVYPFPNGFVQRPDAASPTGVRMNLDGNKLPLKDGMVPLDMTPYNSADGFSPLMGILMHFGTDIDLTTLPDQYQL